MAVRRKKNETPAATLPATGFKQVTKTEKFIEPVKAEDERQTITIPASDVEEIQEPLDRFEEFFARVREQQGWTLMVFRLDSFSKDGKASPRSNNTYIGRMMFDPDTYLDDVQQMCPEGGAFRLQAKDPDGKFSEQWFEQIAAVKLPKQGAPGSTHYFINQPPSGEPEPPRDTLAEFLKSLKTVKEIKEVIGNGEMVREAVPVAATVEREPLQDRIIGAALEAVLKTEKPETAADILRAYIAPPPNEFSWAEIIKEVVKPLAPVVMGLLTAYMQNQARAAQTATQPAAPPMQPQIPIQTGMNEASNPYANLQGQPGPPMPSPWPAPPLEIPQNAQPYDTFQQGTIAPAPMPGLTLVQPPEQDDPLTAEEEEEMGRDDLIYQLAEMLEQCVRKAAADPVVIEMGRAEVASYKARFPLMTGIIDALATLPPEAIIGLLASKVPEVAAMVNNDVAKQTIEDFQAALRRPEVVQ